MTTTRHIVGLVLVLVGMPFVVVGVRDMIRQRNLHR